ncbi:MAG: M24 family metallopeptidase [Nitrososphaeria archaeon]
MRRVEPIGFDARKAAELISGSGLSGILVGSPENVYYTSGLPVLPCFENPILYALRNQLPYLAFVDDEGKVTLFTWFGVTLGVDFLSELVTYADLAGAKDEITSFFRRVSGKVAVDYGVPSYVLGILQAQGLQIEEGDKLMLRLRLVKNEMEIELLRRSAEISEKVISELISYARIGMSREELIREAKLRILSNGGDSIDHITVAFGASNPEILLDERLQPEQLVTLDIGSVYRGYVSDLRKYFYSGKEVPEKYSSLYEKLLGIINRLADDIRPGASFSEIYERAASYYVENGLEPLFASAGHSIGLVTEEAHISPTSDLKFEENMVINIELYAPTEDGIMIGDEETYLVKGSGKEKISGLEPKIYTL